MRIENTTFNLTEKRLLVTRKREKVVSSMGRGQESFRIWILVAEYMSEPQPMTQIIPDSRWQLQVTNPYHSTNNKFGFLFLERVFQTLRIPKLIMEINIIILTHIKNFLSMEGPRAGPSRGAIVACRLFQSCEQSRPKRLTKKHWPSTHNCIKRI